jgi:hypothetical protein
MKCEGRLPPSMSQLHNKLRETGASKTPKKKKECDTHGVSGDRPRRAEYSCGDSDGAGGEGGAGSKFAD